MSYVTVSLPPEIGMALDLLCRHARRPGSVAPGAVLPAVVRLEMWKNTGDVLNDDEVTRILAKEPLERCPQCGVLAGRQHDPFCEELTAAEALDLRG